LEYALGKSPLVGDNAGVTAKREGDTIKLAYQRSSTATDVTVRAYWTDDLTKPESWRTSGLSESMISDDGTFQQWQATVPVTAGQKIFMRLMVTKP
jgi:hypothetical protein